MSAEVKLTEQQDLAINRRDVSIGLSAGAGCGKTFVLTQRFLSYLAPDQGADALGRVVAITFTDRAAREMRDRIRAACHARLIGCDNEEVDHWQQIIRGLDSSRISTIHSFCSTVLRSYAVSADLDPQFALMDELPATALRRKTVCETIGRLLGEEDERCMHLVFRFGLEKTRTIITELVEDRFRVDFDQFADLSAEKLAERWVEEFQQRTVPFLLREIVESAPAKRLVESLQQPELLPEKMRVRRQEFLAALEGLTESADPAAALQVLLELAQVQKGIERKPKWPSAELYETVKDGFAALRDRFIKKALEKLDFDQDDLATASRLSWEALQVAREATLRFERQKSLESSLDFDDLLIRTRNLLASRPDVRDHLASGIQYLLVDEFQDTDNVQSEIIEHLCGDEVFAGKLFLVGDAKQSIYRFRRADPEVFHRLRESMPTAGRLSLTTNFRSRQEILDFVNVLFSAEMGEEYEALAASSHEPMPERSDEQIELLFPRSLQEGAKAEELRKLEADWIARRIRELLEDDLPRIRQRNAQTGAIELRPVRAGDITILFRALSNVALYENALRKQGLDYYLVGGRAFYAQQEVYDFVNLCSVIDEPQDEVALLGVLRSPFFGLSDDTLLSLKLAAGSLSAGLASPPAELPSDQLRQVNRAADVLADLQGVKDRITLVELLNRALQRTGYDAAVLNEFLGRRKLANLKKLLEMARQFDQHEHLTLKDFALRLADSVKDESKEELAPTHPEQSNVIRLMSIHQSKGLEFPVVVLADMNHKSQRGGGSAYFHPELGPLFSLPRKYGKEPKHLGRIIHNIAEQPQEQAEFMRLLYVALTRAKDHLILSAALPEKPTFNGWLQLLADHFDWETGLPREDPYFDSMRGSALEPTELPAIRVHHNAPAPRGKQESESALLPLSQFADAVREAAADEWPELAGPCPAALPERLQLSVSALEEIERVSCPPQATQSTPSAVAFASRDSLSRAFPQVDFLELGTLVHQVLERIDFRQPEQWERHLERLLALSGKQENANSCTAARVVLTGFLESPTAAELADATACYRELDFLLNWPAGDGGTAVISGVIDCLFRTADGRWKIVDYKTGRDLLQRSEAGLLEEYGLQLGVYSLAVEQLWGEPPAEVALVLLGDEVRTVSLPMDAGFLDDVRDRVGRVLRIEAARRAELTGSPAESV